MTTEYEPKTLKPQNREALRFKGRIIAEIEWDIPRDDWMSFTIWETEGGSYIAVTEGSIPGTDRSEMTAEIFPPQDDEFERRMAVMQFFRWHNRARSMVKDQTDWRLTREVA